MEMEEKKSCCANKTTKRPEEELRKLVNRLSRIEGQVNGVKKMLQNDAYCTDILIQVSACQAAFNSFTKELLASHIKGCVAEGIKKTATKKLLTSLSAHFKKTYEITFSL
ncbi:MAG: metal-sensing transcriptional repressor [Treponema succinifaciens]|nr:MAG: metal-sensing transcriptional repressor [Treponema succinifaciens]